MHRSIRTALLATLVAGACACQPGTDEAAAPAVADAQSAADSDSDADDDDAVAADAAPADGPAVAMRYACDADTEVVVFDDGRARVTLPDGQRVQLSRITGSLPPVYAGGSLFFTAGEPVAHLSQGDRSNELACRPA